MCLKGVELKYQKFISLSYGVLELLRKNLNRTGLTASRFIRRKHLAGIRTNPPGQKPAGHKPLGQNPPKPKTSPEQIL